MSISVPAASASASAAVAEAKASATPIHHHHWRSHSKVSFALSPKPKIRFFTKGNSGSCRPVAVMAQLNKDVVPPSSNSAAAPESKSADVAKESNTEKQLENKESFISASEESISEFISQVSSLVKLVDSRDIVELKMKQLDCELLIRKKEAIAPPPTPPPQMVMMQSPPHYAQGPPPTAYSAPPSPAPSAPASPSPSSPPALPAPKPAKSTAPPLKSPMAGTFYRCPAPGAPPFVKVGDKVKKGQIMCIVEAMKLMNEIEADQSGTIVEVLAEDAKPVSIDTPLFAIQP